MRVFQETLQPTIANVAADEALLELAEQGLWNSETLRFWEPTEPVAVLGRSSPWQSEINHDFCQQRGIEFVRRCSGGQSIVTGPGCLMYAVLLDYRIRPELKMLDQAHRFVMLRMQRALDQLAIETSIEGTSDLTIDGLKVSGNSMRCKKNWFLYHGTMICDLDIQLIANCLGPPARQPDYRRQRDHRSFLTQIPASTEALANAISTTWTTEETPLVMPGQFYELTQSLLTTKYATTAWNKKV